MTSRQAGKIWLRDVFSSIYASRQCTYAPCTALPLQFPAPTALIRSPTSATGSRSFLSILILGLILVCAFVFVHDATGVIVRSTSTTASGPASSVPVGASATAACCIADRIAVSRASSPAGMTDSHAYSGPGQQSAQAKPNQHFLQICTVHAISSMDPG